jgi:carbon starvation protein
MLANIFYETYEGRTVLRAMPLLLGALCIIAIAYRFYSAFLAAKVAALDDSRITPAHRFKDGHNYDPTNKWVLFGHHFAAIAGAGPLIGPVLAIQYGYMPGLLWLVIGVCLAGAVQDMLVLAASVRRDGKSLAEIARTELGRPAAVVVSAAILFIVVIALAGLGIVVVKALGGEEVRLAAGTVISCPPGTRSTFPEVIAVERESSVYQFPEGCTIRYNEATPPDVRAESFQVRVPRKTPIGPWYVTVRDPELRHVYQPVELPEGVVQLVPGSSWGTFTIACTIPIALIMGVYITKIRQGKGILEASIFGAVAVIAAVVAGNWIPGSSLEHLFRLTKEQTILALAGYGFIAAVLPVWLLLCPRDYLSSFLKIGTVGLLIVGVFVANPTLQAPTLNHTFIESGPTFKGYIFPFLFICIMCGAVSGFHALVSSGTTPKMIDQESHIRTIGYGAMLMEGLVGVVALIAAASLRPDLYYDINTPLPEVQKWQGDLKEMYARLGIKEGQDPLHQANVDSPHHLQLNDVEHMVGGEALRGRTGGAVTLAVGMSFILSDAANRGMDWIGAKGSGNGDSPREEKGAVPVSGQEAALLGGISGILKYWYHFAIMFEALFILTTIDAGTRIARFLLQEAFGAVSSKFARTDWLPGALLATFLVTAGWATLIATGSISTIWPMFGIANQLLAVMALALVTTVLVNAGKARYAPITVLPMLFVTATTMTAGYQMIRYQFPAIIDAGKAAADATKQATGYLSIALTIFVMASVGSLLLMAVSRWLTAAAARKAAVS